jgi:hypothetical protein
MNWASVGLVPTGPTTDKLPASNQGAPLSVPACPDGSNATVEMPLWNLAWSMNGFSLVLSNAIALPSTCSQSIVAPVRASRDGERSTPFMSWVQRFNLAPSGVVPLLCDCTQSLSSACGPAKCTA